MPISKQTWKILASALKNYQKFIVSTHINPDGDAIGSQMGLYYLLKKFGKSVVVLNNDELPNNYRFLDPDNVIHQFDLKKHGTLLTTEDALIVVDTSGYERIGSVGEAARQSRISTICIDHHLSQTKFGDVRLNDVTATSSGELVYHLCKELDVPLDFEIARSIYAAMLTDTGSFRYPKTTSATHLIVAELLDHGVRPDKTYEEIYETNSGSALRLLGLALNSLQQFENGKLAVITVTAEMMRDARANADDIAELVNYTLRIYGVKIGVLFKENKKDVKISLRSKGDYNVTIPVKKFGGGGHFHASGVRIKKSLAEVSRIIIAECKKLFVDD